MGYDSYKISEDGTIDRTHSKSIDGVVLFFEIMWILSILFLMESFRYAIITLSPDRVHRVLYDPPFSLIVVHAILAVILIILKIVQYKQKRNHKTNGAII